MGISASVEYSFADTVRLRACMCNCCVHIFKSYVGNVHLNIAGIAQSV